MLIRELMVPKPSVLNPDTTLPDALKLMQEKHLHRMPVVNAHGTLVGIVAETDLHNAAPSPATLLSFWEIPALLAKITVEMVMVKDVATVAADTPVEDAARIMADRNIGCLPVMDHTELVGMVNQNDIFRAFMELLGGRRRGVRVWATTADAKGTIARITSAIAAAEGDVVGFGCNQISDPQGTRWELTLKVQDVPREKLVQLITPLVVSILDVRGA